MAEDITTILSEIRAELARISARLDNLEGHEAPSAPDSPWVIPVAPPPAHYFNQMTEANAAEVIDRARYGINWRGQPTFADIEAEYEKVWAFIEKAKVSNGTEDFIKPYLKLDMDMAFVGLLTRLFPLAGSNDYFGYGFAASKAFEGKTVQRFIEEQLSVAGTPGVA